MISIIRLNGFVDPFDARKHSEEMLNVFDLTKEKIEEASVMFVPTSNYGKVKGKLEEFGHVTICGASGEGKTTMSMMLAREYIEKGFHIVFVDKIDALDFENCIKSASKLFLIFDDIFGSVGLSTDSIQLRNMLNSILTHLRICKTSKIKYANSNETNKSRISKNSQSVDIRIVFNSKTYNFLNGLSLLQHEKFYLFPEDSIVTLTSNNDYKYSKEEKYEIFEKYRQEFGGNFEELCADDIYNISDTLFGFPLTCRLFFEHANFRDNGLQFFLKPLNYLRLELQNLLNRKNNQTAALVMMLLCENKINLSEAERPDDFQAMEGRFSRLISLFPRTDRVGICNEVKNFIGSFFTGRDIIKFAHESIYDACACAMSALNKSFVLKYCSYEFLFERIKAESTADSKDQSNFIIISEGSFDLVASRICEAMKEGNFTKSVTHAILEKKAVVQLIFRKLKSESKQTDPEAAHWIHKRDNNKGFLCWAIQGNSFPLVAGIEHALKVKFSQLEIREALNATVQTDNMQFMKLFLSRIDRNLHPTIKSELLLLSAKLGSSKAADYLRQEGADVNATDDDHRNCVHLACYYGNANVLTVLISQKETWSQFGRDSLCNSVDGSGNTPAMCAAWSGSETCFNLVTGETNVDIKNIWGNGITHLVCCGGNTHIVQKLISPSNINSRGQHGWTPVMDAAVFRHLSVFNFLVKKKADQTLVTDDGDSLLHLSCQGGNTDIVLQLLSPSNIDKRGKLGWTPVMKAVVAGHLNVFTFLVKENADRTLVTNDGDSLLHLACQGGNTDIVLQLLSPSNIDERGKLGWTPVMKAVVAGHLNVFNILVKENADQTLVADDGDSLLHLACQGGNTAIVLHLLSASNINKRGKLGLTPVMNAVAAGHKSVYDLLVSYNADLTLLSHGGDSLLHLACQGGSVYIVENIVCLSNINSRGISARTPAMNAAYFGQKEVLELLVENKADLTLKDENGTDIISIANEGKHTKIRMFLETILKK